MSDVQMLPYIIPQPPLILSRRPLQRRQNIVFITLPSPVRAPTANSLPPSTLRITFRPLLLFEPAPLALRTGRILSSSLSSAVGRRDRGRVLAGYERRVAGRGRGGGCV